MTADLLVLNARVVTMTSHHRQQPQPDAVLIRRGRVALAGPSAACQAAAPNGCPVFDAGGRMVLPGFIDPHVHLLAFAASRVGIDCSGARSISGLVEVVRQAAREQAPGTWIRGHGYDGRNFAEGRQPTRWDFDPVTPEHPLRLVDHSGHGCLLNSVAMARVGIDITTPEPAGALIERRLEDGEPTGLLLEMQDVVNRAIPLLSPEQMEEGMRRVGVLLLRAGVTAVQDMGHRNQPGTAAILQQFTEEAGMPVRCLPPALGWQPFVDAGFPPGEDPVKVMLRETAMRPSPDVDEVEAMLRAVMRAGRAVAIHAVAATSVDAVTEAFARLGRTVRAQALRHRIEHASLCSPALAGELAGMDVAVVSNPQFLWQRAAVYRQELPASQLPYLYDVRGLRSAGVLVAAASDAPVTVPAPLDGVRAAVERRGADGTRLPGNGESWEPALELFTVNAAQVVGESAGPGCIRAGAPGDLVVVDGPPGGALTVAATVIGGKFVFVQETGR